MKNKNKQKGGMCPVCLLPLAVGAAGVGSIGYGLSTKSKSKKTKSKSKLTNISMHDSSWLKKYNTLMRYSAFLKKNLKNMNHQLLMVQNGRK